MLVGGAAADTALKADEALEENPEAMGDDVMLGEYRLDIVERLNMAGRGDLSAPVSGLQMMVELLFLVSRFSFAVFCKKNRGIRKFKKVKFKKKIVESVFLFFYQENMRFRVLL